MVNPMVIFQRLLGAGQEAGGCKGWAGYVQLGSKSKDGKVLAMFNDVDVRGEIPKTQSTIL